MGNPARQGCYITAIPHSLGVGGRGLCEGEAENRAGKAALNKLLTLGNAQTSLALLSLNRNFEPNEGKWESGGTK